MRGSLGIGRQIAVVGFEDAGRQRIIVKLRDPSELTRSGMSVTFPLPDLPGRLLVIDPEYRVAVVPNSGDPVLGAQFVKGELRANLYSNGIPEADNRTSIDTVREVLTSTVLSLIERSIQLIRN